MKIKVITDTCSSITCQEGDDLGITVVPLYINDNGVMRKDTIEISNEEFYQKARQGQDLKTTLPAIGDYEEVIKDCDQEMVIVCPAEGLSGTYNSARLASLNFPDKKITVINSRTICASQRHIATSIKTLTQRGKSIEEILPLVEEMINNSWAYMMPVDPKFLKRSGRLSKTAATLLGFLKIVPMLTLSETGNKVEKFGLGIARSMASAVKAVINNMKKLNIDSSHKIYVLHGDDIKVAEFGITQLKKEFPNNEYEVLSLPPVLGVHAGPGTLVIQHIKKVF